MMRNAWLLFVLALATVGVAAQGREASDKAPRMPWGHPDLQGVWNFSSDVPLERPPAFADRTFFTREELAAQREARRRALNTIVNLAPVENVALTFLDPIAVEYLRTSLITYPPTGRLPRLVDGVQRAPGIETIIAAFNNSSGGLPLLLASFLGAGKKDGPEDLTPDDRCLGGSAAPFVPSFGDNYLQIVQGRDHVALLTEDPMHRTRIVPLDGTPHLGESLRRWSGDSRGHWEGETLVIETKNFTNRTPGFAGAGTAQDEVVTERFTRAGINALVYEATIVAPKIFQDKVVVSFPMAKSDKGIYEVACHEGNYAMPNMLSAARKADRDPPQPGGAAGLQRRVQQITLLDRDGKTVRTIGEPGAYSQAALSPDGTRVAVIRTDPDSQDADVWVYDVATGKATPITSDARPDSSPVWSPDGRQIAYVSAIIDDNNSIISRKSADGSGSEEVLYKHLAGAPLVLTDWSPLNVLCFWSGKTTYALPLIGDPAANGTRRAYALSDGTFNVRGGRFSADGRFIAYNSDESGRFQVYAKPFDLASITTPSLVKGTPVSAGQAIGAIFWREDGREICFLGSPVQDLMAADITTSPALEVATPRRLFRLPTPMLGPAQVSNVASRDGQRFLFLVLQPPAPPVSAQK